MDDAPSQGAITGDEVRQQLAELAAQLLATRSELISTQTELIRVRDQQQELQPSEPEPPDTTHHPPQSAQNMSTLRAKLNKHPVFNGKHSGQIDSWTTHMDTYVRGVG